MKTHKSNKTIGLGALLATFVLLAFASGCATKGNKLATAGTEGGPEQSPTIDTYHNGPELPDHDYRTIIFGPSGSGLATVHFDFDSSEIRPDAREVLKKNAAIILKSPASELIQIAGHCDERGTQEYNLALGENRAVAVREYLMRLGVPGDRLTTISYGEEMPEQFGDSENAWAMNRRGVFNEAQQRRVGRPSS